MIHRRLIRLARDPEIPRFCKLAVLFGLAIPGPVDELIIYPAVVAFIWLRRRHVLDRHQITGTHVIAGLATMITFATMAGIGGDMLVKMI